MLRRCVTQPINLASATLPAAKLDYKIVFVLGGPGSGKGTQARLLAAVLYAALTAEQRWH